MSAVLFCASSVLLCFLVAELGPILQYLRCLHMLHWISTLDANRGVSFCNITPREAKFYIDSQKTRSEARYGGDEEIHSEVCESTSVSECGRSSW
jgi:hypothetical protein